MTSPDETKRNRAPIALVRCAQLARGGVGGPTLRGRLTSSPPQFGHRRSIASAHSQQKVHS